MQNVYEALFAGDLMTVVAARHIDDAIAAANTAMMMYSGGRWRDMVSITRLPNVEAEAILGGFDA